MNCESKICLLENVQTVNSVYVRSVHHKISSGEVQKCFFLANLVVIPGLIILAGFTSALKLNMYTVWIQLKYSQIVSPV